MWPFRRRKSFYEQIASQIDEDINYLLKHGTSEKILKYIDAGKYKQLSEVRSRYTILGVNLKLLGSLMLARLRGVNPSSPFLKDIVNGYRTLARRLIEEGEAALNAADSIDLLIQYGRIRRKGRILKKVNELPPALKKMVKNMTNLLEETNEGIIRSYRLLVESLPRLAEVSVSDEEVEKALKELKRRIEEGEEGSKSK